MQKNKEGKLVGIGDVQDKHFPPPAPSAHSCPRQIGAKFVGISNVPTEIDENPTTGVDARAAEIRTAAVAHAHVKAPDGPSVQTVLEERVQRCRVKIGGIGKVDARQLPPPFGTVGPRDGFTVRRARKSRPLWTRVESSMDLTQLQFVHVGIDLRRCHVGVTEKLLNDAKVGPPREQVRRETMT